MRKCRKHLRLFLIVGILSILPCFAFSMSRLEYDQIRIGSSIREVESKAGDPYTVNSLRGNAVEYVYVEKITAGGRFIYENHYVFTVVNGQVVNKSIRVEGRAAYDEMYWEDPNYPTYPYP